MLFTGYRLVQNWTSKVYFFCTHFHVSIFLQNEGSHGTRLVNNIIHTVSVQPNIHDLFITTYYAEFTNDTAFFVY